MGGEKGVAQTTEEISPKAMYPRIMSDDGRPQIKILGLRRQRFGDSYHRLLTVSWRRFLLLAIALYLGVNLAFGVLYWLQPGGLTNARPGSFEDAFFFSVQTLGTIGYGVMAPKSLYTNLLVTTEAFFSIALTAVATGVIFARISRPTARVIFTRNAVITPRNGVPTLMFRAANQRANQILEAEVTLSLAKRGVTDEGAVFRGFYDLKTVRGRSPLFALTWSIMHTIDETSPLYGATQDSLLADQAEVIVVLSGLDETFAQRIHARHSFLPHEIQFGRRFADVLSFTADGERIIDYGRFQDMADENEPQAAHERQP
jgi:inward rectifier potassium channel